MSLKRTQRKPAAGFRLVHDIGNRVNHGSSWENDGILAWAGLGEWDNAEVKHPFLGFRIVLDQEKL